MLDALNEAAFDALRAGRGIGGQYCRSASRPLMSVCRKGGLALGALHEVAGGGNGAIDGAAAALFAAGIAARTGGRVAVVRDPPGSVSRRHSLRPGSRRTR